VLNAPRPAPPPTPPLLSKRRLAPPPPPLLSLPPCMGPNIDIVANSMDWDIALPLSRIARMPSWRSASQQLLAVPAHDHDACTREGLGAARGDRGTPGTQGTLVGYCIRRRCLVEAVAVADAVILCVPLPMCSGVCVARTSPACCRAAAGATPRENTAPGRLRVGNY